MSSIRTLSIHATPSNDLRIIDNDEIGNLPTEVANTVADVDYWLNRKRNQELVLIIPEKLAVAVDLEYGIAGMEPA